MIDRAPLNVLQFTSLAAAVGGRCCGEAADLPAFPTETMDAVKRIYDPCIRTQVHYRW